MQEGLIYELNLMAETLEDPHLAEVGSGRNQREISGCGGCGTLSLWCLDFDFKMSSSVALRPQ